MDREFWLERWQNGEIGFHRTAVHPMLAEYWPRLSVDEPAPVLVPLCGKSLDMLWLRERGHPVTGVELSDDALAQFVRDNGLALPRSQRGYRGEGWNLVAGDWFEVELPGAWPAFYDRAALVALPQHMRPAYVGKLRSLLAPGATGLLLTLEYEQAEMDGPPFSVPAREVRSLFTAPGSAEELERADILAAEPHLAQKGLTALQEVVWRIRMPGPSAAGGGAR